MSADVDVAATLSPRRLRRLARRAHRARLAGPATFEALAATHGMALRPLRRLADAWAAGAAAGVEALGPAGRPLSDDVLDEVDEGIEGWRRRHHPLETLQWEVERNRVTVREVVPGHDRRGPAECLAVFQLRRTSDGGWHLYRAAAHGEWWPVVVRSPRATLADCLEAVRLDVALQFWPRPSTSETGGRPA